MGDRGGIGPELVARVLQMLPAGVEAVVYGVEAVFASLARRGVAPAIAWARRGKQRERSTEGPVLVETGGELPQLRAIEAAAAAALSGEIDALVTAPIHKGRLWKAGFSFPGHTEYLRELTGARDSVMMYHSPDLKVVFATTHIPLAAVPETLTSEHLLHILEIAHRAWPDFGEGTPRIAVAGLNPHAGESGALGDEEERVIRPAVVAARQRGLDASGPYPADTVFLRARRGAFDIVLSLYHDQGGIACKTLGLERTVNVTLGLPIIRTSVDHGTADDIAGRGIADPENLLCAAALAAEMVRRRRSRTAGRP